MLRAIHARVHERNSPKRHTIGVAERLMGVQPEPVTPNVSADWPPCEPADDPYDPFSAHGYNAVGEAMGMSGTRCKQIEYQAMGKVLRSLLAMTRRTNPRLVGRAEWIEEVRTALREEWLP